MLNVLGLCKKLSQCIFGASVLASSAVVQAENLLDIYQLAQQRDPTYLAGIHQHSASMETRYQARAALLPTLAVALGRTDTTQDIVSSDNEVFGQGSASYPTDEYSVSISQSIYDYSNWAAYSAAKARVAQADAVLIGVEQDLLLRVSVAYFIALALNEEFSSAQAERRSLEEHYELLRLKRRDGLARQTDMLDAQARFMQSQSREVEVRASLKDSLEVLRELTGVLPRSLATLDQNTAQVMPDPVDPEAWWQLALGQNPELAARRKEVDAARDEIKRLKGGHYPTVDLDVSFNNRNTQGSLFGGGSEVQTQEINLGINIPLYAGGIVSSRVREAVELLSKVEQDLELELRSVQRNTYASFDGVLTDIAKSEALGKSVEAYQLGVDAKRLAYSSGVVNSLAVLDGERDLYFARSQYVGARYGYLVNVIRLKRAAGVLTEKDLQQINAMLTGGDAKLILAPSYGSYSGSQYQSSAR